MMIRIHLNNRQVQQALRNLQTATDNLTPALADIGEYLARATRQRFKRGEDPGGYPWAPLSQATIDRKGHSRPLIGETGHLRQIR